jgi:phospholipid/cholesterol/gamma-HCH transport system permease protein
MNRPRETLGAKGDAQGIGAPDVRLVPGRDTVECVGDWTVDRLAGLQGRLDALPWPSAQEIVVDGSGVRAMDTAGALFLCRTVSGLEKRGTRVSVQGLRPELERLLALIRNPALSGAEPVPVPRSGHLERIGRETWARAEEGVSLLAFVGEIFLTLTRWLRHPARIRGRIFLHEVQMAGCNALPIIGLLSFLLGVVIAYQGGAQLQYYGANIFIADLVGFSMLRELAPLMTAIIVAGRTGSAFTAQIGTMQVNEEIDALRTMGLAPMDVLVVPRLLALILTLPLLTVYADAMGVFGGMVMAKLQLGIGFGVFLTRFESAVTLPSYLLGIVKAPVFAGIVAVVGCYQGFRVSGGTDSVGRQTTMSVVQSIFLIIVVDAAFSVVFSWLGV